MMRAPLVPLLALLALAAAPAAQPAQPAQPAASDDEAIVLVYHKLSGEPLDLRRAAEQSDPVQRATSFDRPDALRAETARLQARLAGADVAREFVLRVDDRISDYDHDRGEFSIDLFRPGYHVQLAAFGEQYRLVFANAESARAIPMPKEEARVFDAELARGGRGVVNEIHFRVVGGGDPAGAVTGPRVVRGEIVSVRLLDRADRVVYEPRVAPGAAAPGASAAFDLATADVAGFRVGVDGDDLEATLRRLFGHVTRAPAPRDGYAGFATTLTVNDAGCWAFPGRRSNPQPGAVCVTAFLDRDDVVRAVRVERVFPWMEAELFRRTLVHRYGPVAGARSGGGYSLGWGPEVDEALVYDRSGPHTALTAHYDTNDDFMSRGLNRLADVRVVLQLADARWAAARPE